jgi:hypothetical protein
VLLVLLEMRRFLWLMTARLIMGMDTASHESLQSESARDGVAHAVGFSTKL